MRIPEDTAKELSKISKKCGQDERIVQAGGGNISIKLDERYLLIKSSGYQLTEVTADKGISLVDYRLIQENLQEENAENATSEMSMLKAALCEGEQPSIETFLHSITRRYTLHTHPLGVSFYAVREDGMETLKKLFPDALTIPYETPGIHLARRLFSSMKENPQCNRIFLKNHGLVVTAETAAEAWQMHLETVLKTEESLGMDTRAVLTGIHLFEHLQELQPGLIAYRVETPSVMKMLETQKDGWEYGFTPDSVVYCGKRMLVLNDSTWGETLRAYFECYGLPSVILANGYVFAIAETVRKARDTTSVLEFSTHLLNQQKDSIPLREEEKDFLLRWESERYRQRHDSVSIPLE